MSADNPVTVFGYSQSALIASRIMPLLASQHVPSDDVHFMLVGDPSNPDGAETVRLAVPAGMSGSATPDDLYPTNVYTLEYDGFADLPQYPANILSDINATLGQIFVHLTYLNIPASQIASAIELPTTASDTLANFYMIPVNDLPILDPLRFIPVVGQPLYDLLEPDMRILVNLGYGSITDGWSQGPANVPTGIGLFPTNLDPTDVLTALVNGAQQGLGAALRDLSNPATFETTPATSDPLFEQLANSAVGAGWAATPPTTWLGFLGDALGGGLGQFPIADVSLFSSPADAISEINSTLLADFTQVVPLVGAIDEILLTPLANLGILTHQLSTGHLFNAIGDWIAANAATQVGTATSEFDDLIVTAAANLVNLQNLFS